MPDNRARLGKTKSLWKSAWERLGLGGSATSPSGSRPANGQAKGGGSAKPKDAAAPKPQPDLKARRELARKKAFAKCQALAKEPSILDHLVNDLERSGLVGEQRAAKLVYLVVTSRLLERPVSAVVKGPSSVGKSFLADKVIEFFPPSATYRLTAMSDKALAYSEEPLKHRVVVVAEAAGLAGGTGAYLMRSLISEGRLRYETVDKANGKLKSRLIEREGPTGLLVTTTKIGLDPELETRLLSIPSDDGTEQTRAILDSLGDELRGEAVDLKPWHALQKWLEIAEHRVVIPFASLLMEAIPPVAVRLRRDIPAVLSLIKAYVILHQASRDKDKQDRIIATLNDYEAVRDLVGDLLAVGVGASISETVRETVEAVRAVVNKKSLGGKSALDFTYYDCVSASASEVAQWLGLHKSSASRRVSEAIALGYLVNRETKHGWPKRLVPGDPLPDEVEVLPEPSKLASQA